MAISAECLPALARPLFSSGENISLTQLTRKVLFSINQQGQERIAIKATVEMSGRSRLFAHSFLRQSERYVSDRGTNGSIR